MATSDAIRDAADTVVFLLRASLPPLAAPADILVAAPDEFTRIQNTNRPSVAVHISRIAVNPALRNQSRRPQPNGLMSRPLLPLELSIVITPLAREVRDEYRLAGRIIQVLYDHAEMGPADLQGTSWDPGDVVQLIFDALSILVVSSRLQLTYQARVIGIEPGVTTAVAVVASAELRRKSEE